MDTIRKTVVFTRRYFMRSAMDRFWHKYVWRILLAALLITFALSFRGREWNTYGILIFLGFIAVFVGINIYYLRWTSRRDEKKWQQKEIWFEANADGIRLGPMLTGDDVTQPWTDVKAQLHSAGWLFAIAPFPHYFFLGRSKFSDEEHALLKKWAAKLDVQPPENTWMGKK
ncbi:MAG: hypothetical protein INR69_22455 [Mucilaginibacter polytrichastri]|nr:hypothetical protein [Mucilaginibacter polytrichastri]